MKTRRQGLFSTKKLEKEVRGIRYRNVFCSFDIGIVQRRWNKSEACGEALVGSSLPRHIGLNDSHKRRVFCRWLCYIEETCMDFLAKWRWSWSGMHSCVCSSWCRQSSVANSGFIRNSQVLWRYSQHHSDHLFRGGNSWCIQRSGSRPAHCSIVLGCLLAHLWQNQRAYKEHISRLESTSYAFCFGS